MRAQSRSLRGTARSSFCSVVVFSKNSLRVNSSLPLIAPTQLRRKLAYDSIGAPVEAKPSQAGGSGMSVPKSRLSGIDGGSGMSVSASPSIDWRWSIIVSLSKPLNAGFEAVYAEKPSANISFGFDHAYALSTCCISSDTFGLPGITRRNARSSVPCWLGYVALSALWCSANRSGRPSSL